MTPLDVITNALVEIGVLAAGESPSGADTDFCLNKLNRLFDRFNVQNLAIYGTLLSDFVLTPSHNPHTIGPASATPDFTVATARPPRINKANLILTDVSPNIHRPLTIVTEDWWMNNPTPTLETQIPYYLFPNYGWPLGQLYLWPVPTTAYSIRLDIDVLFASMALSDTFTFPPGYEDAVTLSLAEALLVPYNADSAAGVAAQAARARGVIKSANSEAPEMACDGAYQSRDSLPRVSYANFLSGFIN